MLVRFALLSIDDGVLELRDCRMPAAVRRHWSPRDITAAHWELAFNGSALDALAFENRGRRARQMFSPYFRDTDGVQLKLFEEPLKAHRRMGGPLHKTAATWPARIRTRPHSHI